jgi:hypothetical protein
LKKIKLVKDFILTNHEIHPSFPEIIINEAQNSAFLLKKTFKMAHTHPNEPTTKSQWPYS